MASLFEQHARFYGQFYDPARSPSRKRVPLKTDDKPTARRLLGHVEDAFALGEYDPWTDGTKHPLFGWEPRLERDLLTLRKAKAAFVEHCSHLRPRDIAR